MLRRLGQQTLNTFDVNSNLDSTTTQITGGSYFIGTDGRGLLTINTIDTSGDAIQEDFSIVIISALQKYPLRKPSGGTLSNSQGATPLAQSGTGTLEVAGSGRHQHLAIRWLCICSEWQCGLILYSDRLWRHRQH